MAEKKATEKKVAAKKTATKTTATKTTTKRCATKKAEVVVNVDAESVGFRGKGSEVCHQLLHGLHVSDISRIIETLVETIQIPLSVGIHSKMLLSNSKLRLFYTKRE